jgi:hypothetical protein
MRRLDASEFGAGKGAGMNGAHRPDGIYVLAGPDVRPLGDAGRRGIIDVAPTLLALADVPIPQDLDGVALADLLRRTPRRSDRGVGGRDEARGEFDGAQEEEVARRLVALGYLDAETPDQ